MDDHPTECSLCFDESPVAWAVGKCGHPICLTCAMRIRFFWNEERDNAKNKETKWPCPTCRTPLDRVMVSTSPNSTYGELSQQQHLIKNKKWAVWCATAQVHEAFEAIITPTCPKCGEIFASADLFRRHLARVHKLHMCDLCTSNQKLFLHEQQLYTWSNLSKHKRATNSDGSELHPRCRFCEKHFFDLDALADHLSKEHELCQICKQQGVPNQYFINYEALERHFRREHFLCPDEICLKERFRVFSTELELQMHFAEVHNQGRTGGRLNMQSLLGDTPRSHDVRGDRTFTITRGSGPSPRDLRDNQTMQPAVVKGAEPPPDLFSGPSLQSAVAGVASPAHNESGHAARSATVPSWQGNRGTTMGAKALTPEDFPILGGSSSGAGVPAVRHGAAAAASRLPNSVARAQKGPPSMATDDFPTLGSSSATSQVSTFPVGAKIVKSKRRRDHKPEIKSEASVTTTRPQPEAGPAVSGVTRWSSVSNAITTTPNGETPTPPAVAVYNLEPAEFPSIGNSQKSTKDVPTWGSEEGASSKQITNDVVYVRPSNFKPRNKGLLKSLASLLSSESLNIFKSTSAQARAGNVSASEYFKFLGAILGDSACQIFPELVVLLPDIGLGDALYKLGVEAERGARGRPAVDHGCAGLVPCGNCGQILSTADVSIHDEHHIQELLADFPAFGKTVELKSSNGQWGSSKIVAPNKTTKPSVKTAESQKWGGGREASEALQCCGRSMVALCS